MRKVGSLVHMRNLGDGKTRCAGPQYKRCGDAAIRSNSGLDSMVPATLGLYARDGRSRRGKDNRSRANNNVNDDAA